MQYKTPQEIYQETRPKDWTPIPKSRLKYSSQIKAIKILGKHLRTTKQTMDHHVGLDSTSRK